MNTSTKITHERRNGNSTRLIDNAIQIIFNGGVYVASDHYEMGMNRKANKHLFDRIIKRLESEHGWVFEQKQIKIDRGKLEIKLNTCDTE